MSLPEVSGLRLHLDDGVLCATLARPPVNAIDLALVEGVHSALERCLPDARALLLAGEGPAFSAGLDLKAVPGYSPAEQKALADGINRLVRFLYTLPLPTVAAVNGHAIGGGLVLALTCDMRVGARGDYRLGLTETRVGVPYPEAAIAVVRAELAPHVARRMVLEARNHGPAQALRWGVLDELADQPWERGLALAKDLAASPAGAYARIKDQLRAGTELERPERFAVDAAAQRAAEDVLRGRRET